MRHLFSWHPAELHLDRGPDEHIYTLEFMREMQSACRNFFSRNKTENSLISKHFALKYHALGPYVFSLRETGGDRTA